MKVTHNGKELQQLANTTLIDYGARQYNPTLARWTVQDPIAEKYYGISPYAYCIGNPISMVDVNGEVPRIYVETKGLGHAFVTIGNGNNTIVYTYGRYGNL